MKHIVLLLAAIAGTAIAQDPVVQENFQSELSTADREAARAVQVEKPNQIITENATFSGIAVQLVKADNPLQLINPFAPAEYGSGEQNLVPGHDEITGRPTGLSVLTVSVRH